MTAPPRRGPRIGFLYNHEAPHQVPHSAPIAAALAEAAPGATVEALATNEAAAHAFHSLLKRLDAEPVPVRLLREPAWQRAAGSVLDRALPYSRLANLRTHAHALAEYDALVVTETTSLVLRRRLGARCPLLLFVSHGAGDRSIGFRPEMGGFDRLLLAGPKLRNRMIAEGIAAPEQIEITGYAKFDAVGLTTRLRPRLFDNDRPTVLYNPHFEPYLSSWWKFGEAVLDWFAAHPEYNLVFAPHVMLFKRRLSLSVEHLAMRWRRDLPARFERAENIRIDLDGPALFDMTYTRGADIYLGDVSSQVYEFIAEPRPCIFLNGHGARWENDPNYAMWKFGPVLDSVAQLGRALANAQTVQSLYQERQRAGAAETFDAVDQPAGPRAAAAILRALADREARAKA
jgi:hypothetical protein